MSLVGDCPVCGAVIEQGAHHACLDGPYESLDDLPPIPPERRLIFQRELSSHIYGSRPRPKLTLIPGGKFHETLPRKRPPRT